MSKISSYTKLYNVGHSEALNVFDKPVDIEEKVDGSQFSFGVIDGELLFRSKGVQLHLGINAMFDEGIKAIQEISHILTPDYIYRGEYLRRPKHNCLTYSRIPHRHVVIWDIERSNTTKDFLNWKEKAQECRRVGLEVSPLLGKSVKVTSVDQLKEYLELDSFLGGSKIEGVVVKRYDRFRQDGHIVGCKYVSEKFKEKHKSGDWKKKHSNKGDITENIIAMYATEARWNKAYQHLRDDGKIQHSPSDIGSLMKELHADFDKECQDEIKKLLWKSFRGKIVRGIGRGMPEWYKQKLLGMAFKE